MTPYLAWMEWRRLMRTPLPWVIFSLSLSLLSWQFLATLEIFNGMQPSNRSLGLSHHLGLQLYGLASVLILIITPIITIRSFSESFRDGSYALLSSAPLSNLSILAGKFLAILMFQLLFILIPLLLCVSLISGIQLDFGLLFAATLGLLLLSGAFTAIGLYFSTLNENPGIAAAGSYGLLLLISLLDQNTEGGSFIHWLAWPSHYLDLQLGLIRFGDLAYFLLLMLFFLGLALYRLDKRRRG
ncbi:MAG: ABC transporter permease [Candidatus Thiodiazotropha sp. (ex. Lucinisca nassula)]|nr:ABC transporter permease [Candidatus Thiodiazotropha sp. (ex. Lucinisca nassula)]MBW9274160.1 ABC transporter permease [Candidatus Thiodiazotropha sp. (ex. Lucinisca nassula)]PUB84394.1 MAG: ABC transporter permease [gamma proteobacterium symbiont of Ctena orbiculata]PUB90314.1 MAG: ABC transporter permease [gamma proteobacterium symbiont of Ctena orbiculata]